MQINHKEGRSNNSVWFLFLKHTALRKQEHLLWLEPGPTESLSHPLLQVSVPQMPTELKDNMKLL